MRDRVGDAHLIPALLIAEDASGLNPETIRAERFAAKSNHDRGGVVLCRDRARFDWAGARAMLGARLRQPFWRTFRERAYKDIVPGIIVESLLEGADSGLPRDYQLFCFHGEPVMIQVVDGRDGWPGRFMPLGPFATWEEAASAPLIAKPLRGSGGRGVVRLERGAPLPRADGLLIERRVEPHSYARAIFAGAVNTVRIMTARDPNDGDSFIFGTAHRFGTGRSAPTDNRKQGGLVSAIDPASGGLSASIGLGAGNRRTVHRAHPETGAPIAGIVIPQGDRLKDAALTLASAFPELVLVGWDLAVTPTAPVVIEGNAALPNPNLMQAHAPLLTQARVRRFLEHHRVITARRGPRSLAGRSADGQPAALLPAPRRGVRFTAFLAAFAA